MNTYQAMYRVPDYMDHQRQDLSHRMWYWVRRCGSSVVNRQTKFCGADGKRLRALINRGLLQLVDGTYVLTDAGKEQLNEHLRARQRSQAGS